MLRQDLCFSQTYQGLLHINHMLVKLLTRSIYDLKLDTRRSHLDIHSIVVAIDQNWELISTARTLLTEAVTMCMATHHQIDIGLIEQR